MRKSGERKTALIIHNHIISLAMSDADDAHLLLKKKMYKHPQHLLQQRSPRVMREGCGWREEDKLLPSGRERERETPSLFLMQLFIHAMNADFLSVYSLSPIELAFLSLCTSAFWPAK